MNELAQIQSEIAGCRRCERLVTHCRNIAQVKRRAYLDWTYWGRPVPGFGDRAARLLVVGLAPGAHGANRTGRVFTGDRSGDFLYRALYETGFASQPNSIAIGDGLTLQDCYIASSVRCAPPDNKPSIEEIAACRPYLEREMHALKNVRAVVALGRLAFDNYLSIQRDRGSIPSRAAYPFGHGAEYTIDGTVLIGSYHPSQQNTSTGRLTAAMLHAAFARARHHLR